jgi:hypothetical protein
VGILRLLRLEKALKKNQIEIQHQEKRRNQLIIQIEILSHERLKNQQILIEIVIQDKLHENDEEELRK